MPPIFLPVHIHSELDDPREILFPQSTESYLDFNEGDFLLFKVYDADYSVFAHNNNNNNNNNSNSNTNTNESSIPSSSSSYTYTYFDSFMVKLNNSPTILTHPPTSSIGVSAATSSTSSHSVIAAAYVSFLRPIGDLYSLSSAITVSVERVQPVVSAELPSVLKPPLPLQLPPPSPSPSPALALALAYQTSLVEFITFTIKDQFVSRSDMFHLSQSLSRSSTWLYTGQRMVMLNGAKTTVKELRNKEGLIKSGVIWGGTKLSFRSRSARIVWLVQMSCEMWEYASDISSNVQHSSSNSSSRSSHLSSHSNSSSSHSHSHSNYNYSKHHDTSSTSNSKCDVMWDKYVKFLYGLFERWRNLEVSHTLTVVFFSRTFISPSGSNGDGSKGKASSSSSSSPSPTYEDHYKPIIENETRPDWDALITKLKRAFVSYPSSVSWSLNSKDKDREGNSHSHSRTPSMASQGNLLEAINITLNILQLHYMDRDLDRTGNSLVVISPNSGVFEVNRGLAGITRQRMMDGGVGSDMLCLGVPPLHVTPFFVYRTENMHNNNDSSGSGSGSSGDTTTTTNTVNTTFDDWKMYFECPHWLNVCFVDHDDERKKREKAKFDAIVRERSGVHTSTSTSTSSGLNFGANGFVLANNADDKDFSSNTNTNTRTSSSSSSSTKHKQQSTQSRIQIQTDDRDFHEILASVRPRTKGMPRPLLAILGYVDCDDGYYGFFPNDNDNDKFSSNELETETETRVGSMGTVTPHNTTIAASNAASSASVSISMSMSIADSDSIKHQRSRNSVSFDMSETKTKMVGRGDGSESVGGNGNNNGNNNNNNGSVFAIPATAATNIVNANATVNTNATTANIKSLIKPFISNVQNLSKVPPPRSSNIPSTININTHHTMTHPHTHTHIHTTNNNTNINTMATNTNSNSNTSNSNSNNSNTSKKPSSFGAPKQRTYTMNPFKKTDELDLLLKRTHNRRRWSHVFPKGEEEFKRHAGINWKSLCQPALLPLTTDFLPSEQELRDDFTFSHYKIALDAYNKTHYKTHGELLNELILQRLTQDLQIVPAAVVKLNMNRRMNTNMNMNMNMNMNQSKESADSIDKGDKVILSMGHRITELTFNKKEDVIEVTQYTAHFANNNKDAHPHNTHLYDYLVYSGSQQRFVRNTQVFRKYAEDFPWNLMDNLICGDLQSEILSESTKFKRISFAIIPSAKPQQRHASDNVNVNVNGISGSSDANANANANTGTSASTGTSVDDDSESIEKFYKLIEYLSNRCADKFTIPLVRNSADNDDNTNIQNQQEQVQTTKTAILPLSAQKSKNNRYEWAVLSLSSTFNPRRVFRIAIHWLVASSPRIESEVKGLNRRCAQFGLKIQQFPEYSINSNLFVHALIAPPFIVVEEGGREVMKALLTNSIHGFLDDGYRNTEFKVPGLESFEFIPTRYSSPTKKLARQLIHQSGAFFVRVMHDKFHRTVFAYLENRGGGRNSSSNFFGFKGLVEGLERDFVDGKRRMERERAEAEAMRMEEEVQEGNGRVEVEEELREENDEDEGNISKRREGIEFEPGASRDSYDGGGKKLGIGADDELAVADEIGEVVAEAEAIHVGDDEGDDEPLSINANAEEEEFNEADESLKEKVLLRTA